MSLYQCGFNLHYLVNEYIRECMCCTYIELEPKPKFSLKEKRGSYQKKKKKKKPSLPLCLLMQHRCYVDSFMSTVFLRFFLNRVGISKGHPERKEWRLVQICMKAHHVSYDLGTLWVVTSSGLVLMYKH